MVTKAIINNLTDKLQSKLNDYAPIFAENEFYMNVNDLIPKNQELRNIYWKIYELSQQCGGYIPENLLILSKRLNKFTKKIVNILADEMQSKLFNYTADYSVYEGCKNIYDVIMQNKDLWNLYKKINTFSAQCLGYLPKSLREDYKSYNEDIKLYKKFMKQ